MTKLKQTGVLALAILAFILVFLVWSWFARQVNSEPGRGWVGIVPFAGALLAVRTFYVVVARRRDANAFGLLLAAERGEGRRDGETCAVLGELHGREDATISAPFSGEPCILYRYDVSRVESTSGGGHIRPTPYFGRAMAPCEIRTGEGAVALRAFPRFPGFRKTVEGRPENLARADAFLAACDFRELSTSATWEEMDDAANAALAPLLLATGGGRCDFRFRTLFGRDIAHDLSKWELREAALQAGMKVWATGVWSEEGQGLGSGEGAFSPSLELQFGEPAVFMRRAEEVLRRQTDSFRRVVAAQAVLALITAAF